MRTLPALLLTAALCFQADPIAAMKKDLGSGFAVERVEQGILLALPADPRPSSAQRAAKPPGFSLIG